MRVHYTYDIIREQTDKDAQGIQDAQSLSTCSNAIENNGILVYDTTPITSDSQVHNATVVPNNEHQLVNDATGVNEGNIITAANTSTPPEQLPLSATTDDLISNLYDDPTHTLSGAAILGHNNYGKANKGNTGGDTYDMVLLENFGEGGKSINHLYHTLEEAQKQTSKTASLATPQGGNPLTNPLVLPQPPQGDNPFIQGSRNFLRMCNTAGKGTP